MQGKHWLFLSFLILSLSPVHGGFDADLASGAFVRFSAPEFLTFDELVQVSKNPDPVGPLYEKLLKLLSTPIMSNEAYHRGVRPQVKKDPRLGRLMRVATWNIEKSMEIKGAIVAFTDADGYRGLVDPGQASPSSKKYGDALRQQTLLAQSDVIVLQEMDVGVKRSGYVDAARELAQALDLNYAYGVEYLEIDPAYLGIEEIKLDEQTADEEAMAYYRVDPKRYKGLFGSAVLSRYPIKSAEVFILRNQGYDWYWGEKERITFFETSRRFGAETIFKSAMHREMKVGGRIFMRVDLHVPGLPEETLTVINIHLEIKCLPKAREAQMQEILEYLKNIRHPVVMAGDFNSAPGDLSPTSAVREATRTVTNPTTWLTIGVREFAPQSLLVNVTRGLSNVTKNFQNPTARHIPVIAPNKTAGLFKMIEAFRFADGYGFDFRGDRTRSVEREAGLLSNSNQRDRIGYKTTFQLKRTIAEVIGKYRLDWIFVKSFLKDPSDRSGPYRFAPHFGETLEEMNTLLQQAISDHHPNVVDLPFEEPNLED
ncbi:MAG: hypothetical protein A3G87_02970 [Omnitrophica bacterium RIFCSPLOWO2_12_FULL_50_11]|nr:MAG: hypothetical protein A3G87_02970 [Omnitrophica bacterium RIFCSPLOWO2_12_FULL_50_11]